MNIRHDPTVRETVYEEVLESGLSIHIVPKPGFAKTEVTLAVTFGGVDREAILRGEAAPVVFPEGTAHFLEHMLFESESENLSNRFSACGASVNAYTAPMRTAYFFSTTNGVKEPLDLLFRLVFEPTFTEELVDKERAIIAKEIRMYQDDLDQMIYQDILSAMFQDHPIVADIAGTEESIARITRETLRKAYETFYHPAHLHLMVVGDVVPEDIVAMVEGQSCLRKQRLDPLERRLPHREDAAVKKASVSKKRDVKTDMLMIGIKLDRHQSQPAIENDLAEIRLALLLENVLGKTSKNYRDLMDKRLINDTFEFSVSTEDDYGFVLLFTETKKPQATKKALLGLLKRVKELAVDESRFEIAQKKMLGNFIQTFDHVSSLCSFLTEYYVSGVDLFELLQLVNQVRFEDIRTLTPDFQEESFSVVHYHP